MAKDEKLRKRLTRYIEVIEGEVGRGDPLDSSFFRGYDQALGNVAWSLKRILEETESQDVERFDPAFLYLDKDGDEWVDAKELRKVLDWRDSKPSGDDYDGEFYERLRALLTAPKPRTLADMSPEERAGCQWMQADHVEHGRIIITYVSDEYVHYLKLGGRSGVTTPTWLDKITPLPDLPRMEWPTNEPAEDAPYTRTEKVSADEL